MSSSGVIRLCPACKMGYIVSSDLQVVCEGCLGAEHARQAMAPQASCPSCKLFLAEEKQRRLKLFSAAEEESQASESYPLDEFLNARQDLNMSASEGEMASSCAPFFQSRGVKTELPSTDASQEIQKHELQAQQQFQQQLRRRREEEELHRQAELQAEARQESDCHKTDPQHQHHHDKTPGSKPKRPSSLLGNNNVMKLKQIIPLQGKFSSGSSRSPAQSPTGGEAKLPGFLKFLKSPEVKKEPAVASGATSGSAVTSSAPPGGQERSQSPNRSFSPGKLFGFSKSEGTVVCANGVQPLSPAAHTQPSRAESNTTPEELPSNESDKEPRQQTDAENAKT